MFPTGPQRHPADPMFFVISVILQYFILEEFNKETRILKAAVFRNKYHKRQTKAISDLLGLFLTSLWSIRLPAQNSSSHTFLVYILDQIKRGIPTGITVTNEQLNLYHRIFVDFRLQLEKYETAVTGKLVSVFWISDDHSIAAEQRHASLGGTRWWTGEQRQKPFGNKGTETLL